MSDNYAIINVVYGAHIEVNDIVLLTPIAYGVFATESVRRWQQAGCFRAYFSSGFYIAFMGEYDEEGVAYSTADHTTLSGMSIEALYDTYFYYATIDEDYSRTPWGYHFEKELELRETE